MAVPADLQRKHAVVIDKDKVGSGGVSDYPMLVTRGHLDDEVVDPSGSNAARADFGDVRFSSDADGNTMLPCHILKSEHDGSTGARDAHIWIYVRVPTLSSVANTTIYIWYKGTTTTTQPAANAAGGSEAVWAGRNMVLPFTEGLGFTADYYQDASGNGNHASLIDADQNSYLVSDAPVYQTVSGHNTDQLLVDDADSLEGMSSLTISGWFLHGSGRGVLISKGGWGNGFYAHAWDGGRIYWGYSTGDRVNTNTGALASGEWNHVALVLDGAAGKWRVIVGGTQQVEGNAGISSIPATASNLSVGACAAPGNANVPNMIRLMPSYPGLAFIVTENNNESAPATFAAPGTPVDVGGSTPTPTPTPTPSPGGNVGGIPIHLFFQVA